MCTDSRQADQFGFKHLDSYCKRVSYLLVVAGGEVLYGDGAGRTGPQVGEVTVLLENGQGRAVRSVTHDEDAGSGGETLHLFPFGWATNAEEVG